MPPIKIGIIGTGAMARAHADSYAAMRGVNLTACFDVQADRAKAFAEKYNFKHAMTSMDDLLDAVDAVSIVTPDRFHGSVTLAALKADRHVLCEKPLTVTLEEARKVARAASNASKRGVIHMINFSYRAAAAFYEAEKIVKSGKLGEIRHVRGDYLQSWLAADAWGNWTTDWMFWRCQSAAGGGALGDTGCHALDFITGVVGDPRSIRCNLRTFKKVHPKSGELISEMDGKKLDANDTAVIEIDFENGALGVSQITRWATGNLNNLLLDVHGTQGAVSIDLDAGYTRLRHCLGKKRHKNEWTTRELKATPTNYQRFITSIRKGRNDQPDILRGAHVQAMLDACERSAKSGKFEKLRKWQ